MSMHVSKSRTVHLILISLPFGPLIHLGAFVNTHTHMDTESFQQLAPFVCAASIYKGGGWERVCVCVCTQYTHSFDDFPLKGRKQWSPTHGLPVAFTDCSHHLRKTGLDPRKQWTGGQWDQWALSLIHLSQGIFTFTLGRLCQGFVYRKYRKTTIAYIIEMYIQGRYQQVRSINSRSLEKFKYMMHQRQEDQLYATDCFRHQIYLDCLSK